MRGLECPRISLKDLISKSTSTQRVAKVCRSVWRRTPARLQAAVYFDDMYVDSGLQLDTLSRVGNSHYWTTNEFEHDGLHGSTVFKHLYTEALNRGDLEELF